LNPRILLVDDEADARRALSRYLKGLGYETEQADDAEGALGRLAAFDPALVVTDFMMPGMSGLELIAVLRERRPDVDASLTTGTADRQTAVDAMTGGAYDYLPKPIDLDEFA
jgi:two-component system response regulator PilR (NtrC family)